MNYQNYWLDVLTPIRMLIIQFSVLYQAILIHTYISLVLSIAARKQLL